LLLGFRDLFGLDFDGTFVSCTDMEAAIRVLDGERAAQIEGDGFLEVLSDLGRGGGAHRGGEANGRQEQSD